MHFSHFQLVIQSHHQPDQGPELSVSESSCLQQTCMSLNRRCGSLLLASSQSLEGHSCRPIQWRGDYRLSNVHLTFTILDTIAAESFQCQRTGSQKWPRHWLVPRVTLLTRRLACESESHWHMNQIYEDWEVSWQDQMADAIT